MLLAAWIAVAAVVWLVVNFTDAGLLNLSWVILPSAVISLAILLVLIVFDGWVKAKSDAEAKQETLADLGFGLAKPRENQQIAAAVESMFDAATNVKVLGTKAIVPDVKCSVAEVQEIIERGGDLTAYRNSTVCLFENTGEQLYEQRPFRLEPHDRVDRMLFRSLIHWFNHSAASGFHLWYDAVSNEESDGKSSEESDLFGFLTSDMREWLGRHSRWSRMRAWTVVNSKKGTLIYRAGTVYVGVKYPQFLSEMQVFAELRAEAEVTISGAPVKDSGRAPSGTERLLNQLVDQDPVRKLATYWRKKTRIEPVSMVLVVCLMTIFLGSIVGVIDENIRKITGIVLNEGWIIVIAAVLWGLIAFVAYRQCWWQHRRNRRLLKIGHVASGTMEHCKNLSDYSSTAQEYRVQVTYTALDATRTAKWSLFVDTKRAAAFVRSAQVDRQVIVLFNPANPTQIVLPELLAFRG